MDIEKLKALAQTATPGPWFVRPQANNTIGNVIDGNDNDNFHVTTWRGNEDSEFIAAANPAQILKLIEMVEIMKDALEQYTDSIIPYAKTALARLAASEEK